MDIEYTVNQQIISLTQRKRPVNKSQNYLRLSFTFSSDWDGLAKFILFKNTDGTVRASINEDKVIIPPSMLTGRRLLFTVYGVNNEEVRITTNLTNLDLLESGYTSDAVNDDSELDELTTVEEIYAAIAVKADSSTVTTGLAGKVDKINGKGLSANDFTNQYKDQLDNLNTTLANAIAELDIIVVVDELPTEDIQDNKLYFVLNNEEGSENLYDVYVRINDDWEQIDKLNFNISEYAKLTDLPVNVSDLPNDAGYLTSHQSLTSYYTKEQVDTIITNLTNRVVLESDKGVIEKDATCTLTTYVVKDGLQKAGLTVNIYEED